MYSIILTRLKQLANVRIAGIPWWIFLLVGIWIYYTAYQRGKMNEHLKTIETVVDSTQKIVHELKDSLKTRDSIVAAFKITAEKAKVRVVTVDQSVQPKVDSAIAALKENLDSTQKVLLARVVDGYKSRLEARDSSIAALTRLTIAQDSVVKTQARVIELQESINRNLKIAFENAKKGGTPLWLKIAAVGGTFVVGYAVGR